MKIYVGCSLTLAPDSLRIFVEDVKNALRNEYEVLDFLGLVAGTPEDVYRRDIQECLFECDAFIAICDYPATGFGYELGVAVEKYVKPTLALAKEGVKVTRMLEGITAQNYRFRRYKDKEDMLKTIRAFLGNLK